MSRGERAQAPEWLLDAVVLAGLAALAIAIYLSLGDRTALDCDVANLALGIERFDPRQHQPHPPGYLGYVLLLRALHAMVGLTLLDTTRLASRLFALATIPLLWAAGRALCPQDRSVARVAALLAATNPILLYYGVDGQTHSAEAAMAAALLWALVSPRMRATRSGALVYGLLLAFGGSLRPSYALVSVLPVLYVLWPDWKRIALTAIVAALGTLAWLIPTAILSGGWHTYRLANDVLVGAFIRMTSVFSPEHDPRLLALNLRDTLHWTVVALAAPALALLAGLLSKKRASAEASRAGVLLALTAAPAIPFYALILCAEAGYLAGLVPVAALTCAALLAGSADRPRLMRLMPAAIVLLQLGFFAFAPSQLGRTFMTPSAPEIISRELRARLLYAAIDDGAAPGDRQLVVSDYPSQTLLRQLPLLEPSIGVLFLHPLFFTRHAGSHTKSTISYATRHGWLPAPGPALNADGDRPGITTSDRFDWVVIDPRASNEFRALLARQTTCPIAPKDERFLAPRLRPSCFSGGRISLGDYWLRFAAR
ncbi:MAG TPA: hypothetical protein VII38_05575 [Polyangia bacterium]